MLQLPICRRILQISNRDIYIQEQGDINDAALLYFYVFKSKKLLFKKLVPNFERYLHIDNIYIMKKVLNLIFTAVLAVTFIGCNEKEPETPGLNQDLEFTLEVESVDATSAKIIVSHTGTKENTWYGFATTESDPLSSVQELVEEIIASGTHISLKKTTKTTYSVKDLDPETDYTFIAVGLTDEGEVYGTPGSVEFTTTRDASVIEETDDWKIVYERGENQGTVAELFTIECTKGTGCYFSYIDAYSLEAEGMTIADYVKYVIEYEVPTYLSYGYTWADLYISESMTIAFERFISDDYIAVAVGYDEEGNSTGLYSSYAFTVQQEVATSEYSQWLGTWKLTSAEYSYEYEGETYTAQNTFKIDVYPYDNNFMYAIGGWECGENQNLDFTTAFGEDGYIYFPVSYNDGKIAFDETIITYLPATETSTENELAFGLWGICDVIYQGQTYTETYIGLEGATMALASIGSDGITGTINGQNVKYEGYDITYIGMGYFALPLVQNVDPQQYNDYMKFPIAMEKVETTNRACRSVMSAPRFATDMKTQTLKKILTKPIMEF